MGRQLQIHLEIEPQHCALRRCCSCGSYTRPFEEVNGRIRCERCAKKVRRDGKEEEEDLNEKFLLS